MFWHRGDSRGDCIRVERMLADRSAGLLRPAQERWLAAHLRECESCRHEQRILDRVLALVDAVPPAYPAHGLWHRIEMRLAGQPVPALVARRARLRLVPVAATGLALAVAALVGVYGRATAPPPLPMLSPESLAYLERHTTLAHTEPFANHVGLVSFVNVAGSPSAEGTARW